MIGVTPAAFAAVQFAYLTSEGFADVGAGVGVNEEVGVGVGVGADAVVEVGVGVAVGAAVTVGVEVGVG